MKKKLILLLVLAAATMSFAAPPAYRTISVEGAKGAWFDMYFSRIAEEGGGITTVWVKAGDENPDKVTMNRQVMKYKIGNGKVNDIAPESVIGALLDLVKVAKRCDKTYIPVFRRTGPPTDGSEDTVYHPEFVWADETEGTWVKDEGKGRKLVFYLRPKTNSKAILMHYLSCFEYVAATNKIRRLYTVSTEYVPATDTDKLIRVEFDDKAPEKLNRNSPLGRDLFPPSEQPEQGEDQ